MPGRRLRGSDPHPIPPRRPHHLPSRLIPVVAALSSLVLVLLLALLLLLLHLRRRSSRRKTAPSSPPSSAPPPEDAGKPPLPPFPARFSFEQLRLATSDFHPSLKLGQGGFGPVFRGTLPHRPLPVAVKLMSSTSLQGDLEFRNELSLSSALPPSPPFLLLPLGFCEDQEDPPPRRKPRKRRRGRRRRRSPSWLDAFDEDEDDHCRDPDADDEDPAGYSRRRLLLVYDLMENGSLQDALLVRRAPELMEWGRRFAVALDVARGLRYLHVGCSPPVVHGDVKPSNVLLDAGFGARIADFGLARVLEPGACEGPAPNEGGDEEASADEEVVGEVERLGSPELSPMRLEVMSVSEAATTTEGCDRVSVEAGRDWWWRQDGEGGSANGSGGGGGVKDYVMEWIGSEIRKEMPPANAWKATTTDIAGGNTEVPSTTGKKRQHRSRDWWSFVVDERRKKKNKSRRPREWWREEFCEELTKKSKKKQAVIIPKSNFCAIRNVVGSEKPWWGGQDEPRTSPFSKKDRRMSWSRGSSSAQYSTDMRVPARRSIHDYHSGDIPKSGGISSTPSMRGTVCYSAPECGGGTGEFLSEKCDVYSFGVLLLVIVSGRRPLQVTASPMSEFERANLISWARSLAHRGGNLLDLVDPVLHELDRDQALLCITVALLCLQRAPARRPTITEVIDMLSGDLEPPQLLVDFSPSPPCRFSIKTKRKE